MKILVTGGAGFIGSHFVRYLVNKYPQYDIINLDLLTYAGDLSNLNDIKNKSNYRFIKGDICDINVIPDLMRDINVCVNLAAETHVDRSIIDSHTFVKTNVLGTQNLLYWANKYKISLFLQVSTDEVYGSLGETGLFTEETPLSPNSPYSASKASADLLTYSYFKTYHLPVIITRCSNNYGPFQYPEKIIPLFIKNAMENNSLPLYGDGLNIRDWLYVVDHCEALDLIIHKGTPGEIYNIGGNNQITNLELTRFILNKLNKTETLIKFVKDRPGHDRRYATDSHKIYTQLGWQPRTSFEKGLDITIDWYIDNFDWLKNKETIIKCSIN